MQQISELVPITAFFAILLFLLREIIDLTKKKVERMRVIDTYKILIGEEISHNYSALEGLGSVASCLVKAKDKNLNYKTSYDNTFEVETDRYGNEYIIRQGKR